MKITISGGAPRIFLCDRSIDCRRYLSSPKDILCEPILLGLAMADSVALTPKDSDYDLFAACYPYMLASPLCARRFGAKLRRIDMEGFCTDARTMWERMSEQLRRRPITLGRYLYGMSGGVGVPFCPVSVWDADDGSSDARLIRIALPSTAFFSLPDRPDQPESLRRSRLAGKQLSAHEERVLITDNLLSVCRDAFSHGKAVWLVTGDRPVIATLPSHDGSRIASGLSLSVGNYADIAQFLDYLELRAPHGKLLLEARDACDVRNAIALSSAFPDITVGIGAGIAESTLPPLPPHCTVFMQDPVCPAAFPAAPSPRLEKLTARNLRALLFH